jgi:hypothetical protein
MKRRNATQTDSTVHGRPSTALPCLAAKDARLQTTDSRLPTPDYLHRLNDFWMSLFPIFIPDYPEVLTKRLL